MSKINSYEPKFHQIVNNLVDAIVEIDLKGNFTYTSPQIYNILGYYPNELIGVNGNKFIHPEDLPKVIKEMEKLLKKTKKNSVKTITMTYRILHKKGHYFFLSARGSLVEIEGNLKIIAVLSDITEQMKSEQKLKESEEKYREILENMMEGYFETDLKGNLTFVNDFYCKFVGYSKEELIGMNYRSIFDENRSKEVFKNYNQLYNNKISSPLIYENNMLTKSGETVYYEVLVDLKYDSEGNKVGFFGLYRDITERKKSEQKLKESEEKFRTIAEQSFVGFIIIQNNHIIYSNNTASKIYGYSFEELNLMKIIDVINFVHPEDRYIAMNQLKKRKEGITSEMSSESFRIITKSGELKWVEVFTKMFKFQKKNTIFVTIVDVTKERMAENELQKLNDLKSEFLKRASHELKTPLISIKGFTHLVLQQYSDSLENEAISMLEEVDRGCHRLEDIIKNLIETTKLESSMLELETVPEDLSFLIRFCLNDLKGLVKSRNHVINVNINKKIITKINKEQMYEVLTNLLSNAIKYTPPNGEITIKSEIKDQNVIVSIHDNGIGFTDKDKEKVFKQFGKIERYGQGLDIGIDGSGLGLYLSKKIVELHGGELWMESEGKNKGSIFYFLLPLVEK